MEAWISPDDAVYPYDAVYPPGETHEPARRRARWRWCPPRTPPSRSRSTELGYRRTPRRPGRRGRSRGTPADGELEAGDVILAVDGDAGHDELDAGRRRRSLAAAAGEAVDARSYAARRRAATVTVTPETRDGRPVLGIELPPSYRFPVRRDGRDRRPDRRPERRADVLPRHLRHADARLADRRRRRRHRHDRRRRARSARSAASSRRSRRPRRRRRAVPGAARQLRRGARRAERRHDAGAGDTMHDAVDALEAWVDDPDADLPSCEEASRRERPATSTSTPPWPPPSSRSRPTSPRPAGTSRPGSTPWSRPPGWCEHEPALAAAMGLDSSAAQGSLTPVEQDQLAARPAARAGAGVDRLARRACPAAPRSSSGWCCRRTPTTEIPEDPAGAEEFAREHPDRQEVRIVAGATRAGATYCALRLRAHDDDQSVVGGQRPGAGAAAAAGRDAGGRRVSETCSTTTTRADRSRPRQTPPPPRRSRALIITAVGARGRLLRAHHVRGVLHRPAVVRRDRLLRGLQHPVLDPGRAVPGLRRR